LHEASLPPVPFEVGVWVKLDDESGAAGLVLHSDGSDKHYGFYPSGGRLRFSRFEGPDVFSWNVLREEPSADYKPGEWNHLKVRVGEKGKFTCYVNDALLYEMDDDSLPAGKLGLAKFRDTQASFKQFRAAEKLPAVRLDDALAARLSEAIDGLPDLAELSGESIAELASEADASRELLRREAKDLERRAASLRSLANELHAQRVAKEIGEMLARSEEEIDLARAALLIAWLDDEELDVDAYRQQIDRMGQELSERIPADADDAARREALHKFLFEEHGFHGSRSEYYHRANSHLSRVLDDREGLPITLSVLYMDLGGRAGMEVSGVGLPGHFVVKQVTSESEQLIDVFDRGALMSRDDADEIVRGATGRPLDETLLAAATKRAIVLRMLSNLIGLAQQKRDREALLRYLEAWLAIDPEAAQERGLRAVVRFESGRRAAAVADLDVLLDRRPEGADLERIAELREYFQNAVIPVSP
jgi:serine protease Do